MGTASVLLTAFKDSLYTKVEPEHLHLISRVCHKTKLEYVKSIFLNDLIPGGDKSWNKRAHSNFTPLPPFDKRNIAAGRLGDEYNVVIVYSKEKLPKYDLMMSMSAVLVTDAQIPWSAIDLIYLVPSLKSGPAWVLYDPEHIGKTITGHNLPIRSGNAVAWSAKARGSDTDIIDGSGIYNCRIQECPNCQSCTPDGFASCLKCRVKFTFDDIEEESKEAKGPTKKSGNAGSASSHSNVPAPLMVSLDVAASEAIRIARRQIRENEGRAQAFRKPGDILWELVNGNMKWRMRFDHRPEDEKQKLIAAGGSRFCAGTHFGVVETSESGRHLDYGGPNEFLTAQAEKMSVVDADGE